MPDNTWQLYVLYGQCGALVERYRRDPNTFIGINVMLCYREDGVRHVLVPDLFVVFGVPNKDRPSYKVWEEGKVPAFVLEVASEGTYKKDLRSKKNAYERMGGREYCVFDPKGDMHRPRLQLFRLEEGIYEPANSQREPDGSLAVMSETLGLELRFLDDRLRLWNPVNQEYLLEHHEERAGRIGAEQRIRSLESEVEDLKERLRGQR